MSSGASQQAALVRTLYRAFVREARRVAQGRALRLVAPLGVETIAKNYGRGAYLPAGSAPLGGAALQGVLFGPETQAAFQEAGVADKGEISGPEVLAVVRRAFQSSSSSSSSSAPSSSPSSSSSAGIDAALRALQALNRQRALQRTHTSTTTSVHVGTGSLTGTEVRVDLATSPVPGLPSRLQDEVRVYPFAYRVRVTNTGSRVVQLMSRHWRFEDTQGGVIEVPRGSPGVVGHTPHLDVGQTFEYVSGTQLRTPTGTMRGSFGMVVPGTGEKFEAIVGKTELIFSADAAVEKQRQDHEGGSAAAAAAGGDKAGARKGGPAEGKPA
jgi:ApaG protein